MPCMSRMSATGRPRRRPALNGCCARREVPIGLLFNHTHLRLVYAPRGETSGYATFSVADMATVAGRPIFAALHMLLSAERLFSLPEKQRLPAILADSRKYQNCRLDAARPAGAGGAVRIAPRFPGRRRRR